MKVKNRNKGEYKVPPPCQRYRMIRAISHRKDAELQKLIDISQSLPSPEPDLYNKFISTEPDYIDCLCINFPWHCILGHVLMDSNPFDNVDS